MGQEILMALQVASNGAVEAAEVLVQTGCGVREAASCFGGTWS